MKYLKSQIKNSLVIAFLSLSSFVLPYSSQNADDQAVRQLVDRYFSSFINRDLDAYVGLWSPSSPDLPSRREAVAQLFQTSTYRFSPPHIARIKTSTEKGSVWVTTRRTITRGGGDFSTGLALALDLTRENGDWKIRREAPAVAELASLLVAASGNTERNELLQLDPELLTRDLLVLLQNETTRRSRNSDHTKALEISRLIQRIASEKQMQAEEATAWRSIGDAHYYRKEFEGALDAYRKGLSLEEKLGREFDQIVLSMSSGLALVALNRTSEALAIYGRSLALSEKVGDKGGMSDSLERRSRIHRDEGRLVEASRELEQSVTLREAIRDRPGAAQGLLTLAEIEYDQGELDRAVACYHRALTHFEALGRPDAEVYTLHNIANISYLLGNLEQARSSYLRELKRAAVGTNRLAPAAAHTGLGLINTVYGDYAAALAAYEGALAVWRQTTEFADTASAHQKVGSAHYLLGNFEDSETHYREALRLREILQDRVETGWALLDVVIALSARKKFDEALSTAERSMKVFDELRICQGSAAALVTLSGIQLARDEFRTSLELADRGASVSKECGDREMYWMARHRAGKAHIALKQTDLARLAFSEAIAAIEVQQPAPAGSAVNRSQRMLETKLAPYLAMVDLNVFQHKGVQALIYAERAKHRVLKLILEGQRRRINKTMTAGEIEQQKELSRQVATLMARVYRESEKKLQNSKRLAELNVELNRVREAEAAFERDLYVRRPEVKVLRGDGETINSTSLRSLTSSLEKVILTFVETEEQIYLFALSRGPDRNRRVKLNVYALGVTRAELSEIVIGFARTVAERRDGWETSARHLYETLIKPAEPDLKGRSGLVIIPDGIMWNIPFSSLLTSESTFLIERYSLSYASSLTALSMPRKAPVADRRLPLEYSDQSTINDASPFFSQIGATELRDLLDWNSAPQRILLSSSELLPRAVSAGRGLTGLWWALLIAGCDSSIVGIWRSDEASAAVLVATLRTLPSNTDGAKALQIAVKETLRKPEYRHPYFWAGVVHSGR